MELAFKQHSGSLYGQVWWSFGHSTVKFWWHCTCTDKFGGGHSVSWSAVKIGGHIQQQTQEPPQEELLVVMSMSSVVLMVLRLRWLYECVA